MAAVIPQRLARVPWRAVAVLPLLALSALAPADSDRRPRLNRRIVKVALRGLGREGYLRLVERVVPQLAGKADAATIAYGAEATGRVIVVTATDGVVAQRVLATAALARLLVIRLATHLLAEAAALAELAEPTDGFLNRLPRTNP